MTDQTGQDLKGKVAVITGAGRGIGRAIALGYARAGASICCVARTESEIQATAGQIQARGGTAISIQADVTHWSSVKKLFESVDEKLGGIDIVVLNAGASLDHRVVEESDPRAWEETLRTNLVGSYFCAKAAIPSLKKRRSGKIIVVGSGMGHNGKAGGSAYSCSKAGLWMLTRILAQELWQYDISVNELVPGPVRTDMGTGSTFDIESEWVKSPQEVVPLALFLATQPEIGPTAQSYSLMRRDT